MRNELELIGALFFEKEYKIHEYDFPFQNCVSRCGVWVTWFIEMRLTNTDLASAYDEGFTSEKLDAYRRTFMVEKIKTLALQILDLVDNPCSLIVHQKVMNGWVFFRRYV